MSGSRGKPVAGGQDPADEFDLVYRSADVYGEILPEYRFDGAEDTGLVAGLLDRVLGPPGVRGRRTLELGCGAGRITRVLAPRASDLCVVDSSVDMLRALRRELPTAATTCADIRTALRGYAEAGARFGLVGSFWSLNYPLLACFEDTTADGVTALPDVDEGLDRARRLVGDLVRILEPGGHLVLLFFDADSPEQRLVTRLWERIAPFPGTGRDFTWHILLDGLRTAERNGVGRLSLERRAGHAVSANAVRAQQWFALGHLNGLPALIRDREVLTEVAEFVDGHRLPDGSVEIPTSVHLVHFRSATE